jgi:hypothetical protein
MIGYKLAGTMLLRRLSGTTTRARAFRHFIPRHAAHSLLTLRRTTYPIRASHLATRQIHDAQLRTRHLVWLLLHCNGYSFEREREFYIH